MIKYYNGTVFNSGADVFVNTVNTVGVMGAGIALEFKLRYPKLEKEYLNDFENNKLLIGLPRLYRIDGDIILNFPTKKHWKNPSQLSYIEAGLKYITANYKFLKKQYNIQSIAFPKLGAGKGNLNWNDVNKLMVKYLESIDLDVHICLDELPEAEGIEKRMLDFLNKLPKRSFKSLLNLNTTQTDHLLKNIPLNRFWKLSKIKGIGSKSYNNIHKIIYNIVTNKNDSFVEQISLLDISKKGIQTKDVSIENMTKEDLIKEIKILKKENSALKNKLKSINKTDSFLFKRQITNEQILEVKKLLNKKLSQKEIANIVKISTSSVSRINNGHYDKYLI